MVDRDIIFILSAVDLYIDQIRGHISRHSTKKFTWMYSSDIALSIKLVFCFRHQALFEITKK